MLIKPVIIGPYKLGIKLAPTLLAMKPKHTGAIVYAIVVINV